MQVDIISPEATLFSSTNAQSVTCPGLDGSFQLLANHAPIVAALKHGQVIVEQDGEQHTFEIKSGIVEVQSNKVNLLVEA